MDFVDRAFSGLPTGNRVFSSPGEVKKIPFPLNIPSVSYQEATRGITEIMNRRVHTSIQFTSEHQ